ncbi:TrlF family AAA-like ATPase [Lacimicrobium alkaliphilum]|uniref:Phosphoesterase n=1 Tax=Lacimicrobium alkaliphilum TaxID=1526571 RepID=A0ABQ1R8X6_9ALTE|nr:AAA family ATPase [Lacimicrobium alkaliphilum]GGD61707.1 phosphoesterase [Lacimicrobium alkaliphilum]
MKHHYKGMRWLKCDLQMQTPADSRHWQGDRLLGGEELLAAKAFAEACFQAGLDIVGITDHNFLSKEFIPYLKTAFEDLEREHNHSITLFPGFEFEAAGVGRGVHVLCLFEPSADLVQLDAILTECGVTYPRVGSDGQLAKSDKNLKDILQIVQDKYSGIVIMPHAMSNDGIFDNESISDWLQQDQFTNPGLLAIEVPKPVNKMSAGYQRLLKSGDDCQPGWRRVRPIATIMSSDNKKLIDLDQHGAPTPNSIGYRYSWIKMSSPSIESLRQAFLDHQSRILLPENVQKDVHPENRIRQAIVHSISVKNVAFLDDQEIHFSPNMNCVIGGRGSGKSTLLEYLRIIFSKDKSEDIDDDTISRIKRVRDTLNSPAAELEVTWISADNVRDRIVWQNGQPAVHRDDDLYDPETFFQNLPISFFSQQQLNRLTESKTGGDGQVPQAQRLLDLIDGFATNELSELSEQERKLTAKIQTSFSKLRQAKALKKDLKKAQQEYQELDRQWKARSEIQADATRHEKLTSESRYLESLEGEPGKRFKDVVELANDIASSHASFQIEDAPHQSWFKQFDLKVKQAKENLADLIRQAVEQYQEEIESLTTEDPTWGTIEQELEQADANFTQACTQKGLTPDDVGHLKEIDQAKSKKQQEVNELKAEVDRLKEEAGNPEEQVQQLHLIWQEQLQKRIEAANRANRLAVQSEEGRKFIEVSVQYQFDQTSFFELWNDFGPKDGRTALARAWSEIGSLLIEEFRQLPDNERASPWDLLRSFYAKNDGEQAQRLFPNHSENLKQYIVDNLESWDQLRLSRVKDVVDLKLFRPDGTVAGSISEGSLSDGQRNTAALALLLAQDGGPLVIDQPEDELDSNFVFKELIPMLRKVKVNRQIIIATHNANLPVNGDAELVYALEARDGKGMLRAEGGLDHGTVTAAVLDIMEGTEEAFRRRREKYHF